MLRGPFGALAAALLFLAPASAADREAAPAGGDLLFVQMADAIRFDGDTLTLEGVGPATLFFSDRPKRLVGHMANQAFVDLWQDQDASFAGDPPNAALAFIERNGLAPAVVELTEASLEGRKLVYRVRVLEGEIPAEGGPASLFVDRGGGGHGGGGHGGGGRGAGDPGIHMGPGGEGRGGDPGDRWGGSWEQEDWPGEYGSGHPYSQCNISSLFDKGFSSLCL